MLQGGGISWGSGGQGEEVMVLRALDSTSTTSGNVLIPLDIDRAIAETALVTSGLLALIPETTWRSGTYDQNRRTALGRARFVGDNTSAPEVNSTYGRYSEPLKQLQYKSGVTGFLEAASQELLDALQSEVVGGTISTMYEKECYVMYGNSAGDPNSITGLQQYSQNANGMLLVDGTGTTINTGVLDAMIDGIQNRGVRLSALNSFLQMTHKMQSKLSAVVGYGVTGGTPSTGTLRYFGDVEVAGGFRLMTYRGIPIVPTSFGQSDQAWTGGTMTGADTSADGGTLTANTTYRYFVSAILQTGETLPSNEVSVTTANDANNAHTITLTITAVAGARFYMIYRTAAGGAAGSEVHYTTIQAAINTVDSLGFITANAVTKWKDTGVRNVIALSGAAPWMVTGANYTPSVAGATLDELATTEEDIYLCTTMVPGIQGRTLHMPTLLTLSYYPLAPIADKSWFLLRNYFNLICVEPYQSRCFRVRNA